MNLETQRKVRESKTPGREDIAPRASVAEERRPAPVTATPKDIHTSDLTASCAHSVELRHAGKIEGQGTSALLRGNLFHAVLQALHRRGDFSVGAIVGAVNDAGAQVQDSMARENRPITPAALAALPTTKAEVAKLSGFYGERLAPMVKSGKLIGCELPIRCEIDGFSFASHLDLLWRDSLGELRLWDYKSGEDTPTFAYLSRNPQLGMYSYALRFGEVLLPGGWGWTAFEEVAQVSWIHLNNLAPYSRKTKGAGDDGQEREFAAGEHRPLSRIIHTPNLSNFDAIREMFLTRARMMEAGFFPTNPDPVGCQVCESRKWCGSFSSNGGNGDE